MKKLFCLLLILLPFSQGWAQYDAKALEILDAMSEKYKAIPAFNANFTYSLRNPEVAVSEDFSGKITVKGEMFVLKIEGQEIFNNGDYVWVYLQDANEVTVDYHYPEEEGLSLPHIYSVYKKGYKYLFLEETKIEGITYQVIDLIPENREQDFYKIRMTIHKKDKTLKSWEIFDRSGGSYLYTVTQFTPDINVADAFFAFDVSAHEAVEVVDLRE